MTDGNHEASNIHTKHVLPLYARINELEAENAQLRAEAERHRERANDAQVSWEVHRDICAQYKIREELAAAFGTEDPVEAATILRQMQADAERLRAVIRELVIQFAYEAKDYLAEGEPRVRHTGGLSALEEAFDLLGWTDPMPIGVEHATE